MTLSGCALWENKKNEKQIREEKNLIRMKKIENIRLLRVLLIKNEDCILARRVILAAGEQLNLQVRLFWTAPENISPLLRSGKADLAFGKVFDKKESARLRLEGYILTLPGKEKKSPAKRLFFSFGSGSAQLWEIFEKASLSAWHNGRISTEAPTEEELDAIPEEGFSDTDILPPVPVKVPAPAKAVPRNEKSSEKRMETKKGKKELSGRKRRGKGKRFMENLRREMQKNKIQQK